MEELRVAIAGAGRMGLTIAELLAADDGLSCAGIWTRRPESVGSALLPASACVGDDLAKLLKGADVLIDFSLAGATKAVCTAVETAGVPLVCGVSGLGDAEIAALDAAAREVVVVYDRNMSRGVTVLHELVREAAQALGVDFEVRIDEVHHIHKKDAPSGTALKLGEAVASARGLPLQDILHYEPDAPAEGAPPGHIHFHVERRGEVPGDHEVEFRSASERLTLAHSVTSRDVFARGALAAARWCIGRPPGRYSMRDVLFGAD